MVIFDDNDTCKLMYLNSTSWWHCLGRWFRLVWGRMSLREDFESPIPFPVLYFTSEVEDVVPQLPASATRPAHHDRLLSIWIPKLKLTLSYAAFVPGVLSQYRKGTNATSQKVFSHNLNFVFLTCLVCHYHYMFLFNIVCNNKKKIFKDSVWVKKAVKSNNNVEIRDSNPYYHFVKPLISIKHKINVFTKPQNEFTFKWIEAKSFITASPGRMPGHNKIQY